MRRSHCFVVVLATLVSGVLIGCGGSSDTDAGATKVYQSGDTVTVQVSMPGASAWPGASAMAAATKTYDVVA